MERLKSVMQSDVLKALDDVNEALKKDDAQYRLRLVRNLQDETLDIERATSNGWTTVESGLNKREARIYLYGIETGIEL